MFYAAPLDRSGGTGSADDPFGTLTDGLSALTAGDTLLLRGGTYHEQVDLQVAPGTRTEPIVVRPAPGQRPLLKGLLWIDNPSWWHIEGLNVTWDDRNRDDQHMVKISGGTDWELTDAEISDARSFAALLVAGDSRRFALRRLYVHDTEPANGTNEDHLIYLNSGLGGGVVENCLLVGSPNGRAVKIGPADSAGPPVGNLTIRYNTMIDNEGPSNIQVAWRSRNNEIYRNIMIGTAAGRANVTAFGLRGSGNAVHDNIGWRSSGVVEAGVRGLEDAGGNRFLDPRLRTSGTARFAPTSRSAESYGYLASPATATPRTPG